MENKIETKRHEPIVYRVYDYLKKNHYGKENGIKKPFLASVFDITPRGLRKITQTINESDELEKLVSTSHCCYMCKTKEECEKAIRTTYSYAIASFKKAKKMERKTELNNQIKISVGDELIDIISTFEK